MSSSTMQLTSSYGRTSLKFVEGTVETSHAIGLKIGGRWLYASDFYPVVLPKAGARVRVQVDELGYIADVDVLDAPQPMVAPDGQPSSLGPGRAPVRAKHPHLLIVFAVLVLGGSILGAGWLISSTVSATSAAQLKATQAQTAAVETAAMQASNDASTARTQAQIAQSQAAHDAQMQQTAARQAATDAQVQQTLRLEKP